MKYDVFDTLFYKPPHQPSKIANQVLSIAPNSHMTRHISDMPNAPLSSSSCGTNIYKYEFSTCLCKWHCKSLYQRLLRRQKREFGFSCGGMPSGVFNHFFFFFYSKYFYFRDSELSSVQLSTCKSRKTISLSVCTSKTIEENTLTPTQEQAVLSFLCLSRPAQTTCLLSFSPPSMCQSLSQQLYD